MNFQKVQRKGVTDMSGRPAKPIELLISENRKHLTKDEIERRKKSEVKFGDKKMKCPDYVRSDPEALKKWREITMLYKGADFVASGDSGMLARYCKTHSEYSDLLESYQRVKEIHYDSSELDEFLDAEIDEEDKDGTLRTIKLFSYKVKKQLRDMISINALLTIETAINKKMDMLIKMEDRMFLNPLAKVKNVPKGPAKETEDPLMKILHGG